MSDKTDRLKGKAEEAAGRATGDPNLKQRGQDRQAKGNFKSAFGRLKNAFKKSA